MKDYRSPWSLPGSLATRVVTLKVSVGRDIWEATREEVDTNLKQFMVEILENN